MFSTMKTIELVTKWPQSRLNFAANITLLLLISTNYIGDKKILRIASTADNINIVVFENQKCAAYAKVQRVSIFSTSTECILAIENRR
jgi:hypothetical protein